MFPQLAPRAGAAGEPEDPAAPSDARPPRATHAVTPSAPTRRASCVRRASAGRWESEGAAPEGRGFREAGGTRAAEGGDIL